MEAVGKSAIIRIDGSIESVNLPDGVDRDSFAIIVATIYGASKTLLEESKLNDLRHISIKDDRYSIEIKKIDSRRLMVNFK